MALSETTEWYIGITEDSVLELRRTRIILDDGRRFGAEQHNRIALEPGSDVTGYPQRVRALANFLWTPQVIAAWQAKKASAVTGGVTP